MTLKNGRAETLAQTLSTITKRFGEGSIMRLGDAQHLQIEAIPTGSIALDIALGVGGVPRGRVIEIYGPESSGKTTLCQHEFTLRITLPLQLRHNNASIPTGSYAHQAPH